ncbi:MAG: PQQ-dependent sugar dehydrogenase [Rhodococcus sp.]|nr:PQQ-dependent sugar dehydrogenase [Rhodococcus sp. (in: high G+C Gram-positive bacteria)]MBY4205157.1 PQQ-dependent sugar dehydrogenase [Rhodococcus fascians]MCX6493241.1 PQQ-dependent sugar dehydrogenase [Rhodococcus sp. (in: high G+C Gram-positive bacteria)]
MKPLGASSRTARAAVVALSTTAVLLAGCARFDDSNSSPFTPAPDVGAAELKPTTPSETSPPAGPNVPQPVSGPCVDPDPAVIATCLDTTGGLVALPDGQSSLVAERRTGRIMEVTAGRTPQQVATIPVDGTGDGGLLDIALSPTYAEDKLLYALITTASDTRVVRLAQGDVPKDILTGIPRGAAGVRGSLEFYTPNELLVLTGDNGDPVAAANPNSLSGKLLRVTSLSPTPTPPRPGIALSGIGTAGDVCTDGSGNIYVTDRTATEDRLQRIDKLGAVFSPVWTWPDRPGVAGCAAGQSGVAVALTTAKAVAALATDPNTGAVSAEPTLLIQDKYGQLNGATSTSDGQILVGTVNKNGTAVGPTDDRVVKVPFPAGGGGGFD